jgi:hypothetical protein
VLHRRRPQDRVDDRCERRAPEGNGVTGMSEALPELDVIADLTAEDHDGQIHFSILPGSVAKNRHLLGRTTA